MKRLLALLLIPALLLGCAAAEGNGAFTPVEPNAFAGGMGVMPSITTLTVTGEGIAPLGETQCVLTLTARVEAETAAGAASLAETAAAALRDSFGIGVTCEVEAVQVEPVFTYAYGKLSEKQVISSHAATARVVARSKDEAALLAGLDVAMLTQEADEYQFAREPVAREQAAEAATAQAVNNAMARAQAMAQAAGLTVGKITEIQQTETVLSEDGKTVTATVEITFQAQ